MPVAQSAVVKLETLCSKRAATAVLCPQNCHFNQQELIKLNLKRLFLNC